MAMIDKPDEVGWSRLVEKPLDFEAKQRLASDRRYSFIKSHSESYSSLGGCDFVRLCETQLGVGKDFHATFWKEIS